MAVEVKEFRTPQSHDDCEGYCLRCTTTGLVFGPTLDPERGPDDAEAFLAFLHKHYPDPRAVAPRDMADLYALFCQQNAPVGM
ncbi:MAG: hypothetical protein E4G90_10595 [Gemmatimonadales bacterium]|nr:MAG: hypothetical protein E4G90_10595 [Gemmatimonadales bacterium]